jgi:hypothetical protein
MSDLCYADRPQRRSAKVSCRTGPIAALSADIGSVIWRLASARAPERQIKSARVSYAGMLKAAPRRIACGVTVCFASRRKTNFQVG